jgi:hypothetical protein
LVARTASCHKANLSGTEQVCFVGIGITSIKGRMIQTVNGDLIFFRDERESELPSAIDGKVILGHGRAFLGFGFKEA